MGYAVHQLGIDLMSCAFLTGYGCSCFAAFPVENFHVSTHCLFYQLVCLANTVGYLTADDFLAVKAVHGYFGISRHDDAVRRFNLFCSQYIFCACGASGLNLNLTVCCSGCLFQCFCCHIGMSDSGRTGGHCQQLKAFLLLGGNTGIT